MKLQLSWVSEYVPLTRADQSALDARLPEIGIELAGRQIVDGEPVLEVEITANRGDLLSVFGMAREIGLAFARRVKEPAIAPVRAPKLRGSVKIDRNCGCRRYFGARIENVRVGPSSAAVAKKLRMAGFAVFNNVVDVTNLLLMEFGQPLHTFDAARLNGSIHARRARVGERLAALDGKTYELSGDLVIADASRPVAIAGVIGGGDTAVSGSTRTVFLECAWFDSAEVRRTSRRLGITTESSFRFERHVNPSWQERVFHRAIRLIEECSGGKCVGIEMVGESPKAPGTITVTEDDVERILGVRLPKKFILKNLVLLGCGKVRMPTAGRIRASGASSAGVFGAGRWKVTPPLHRPDLKLPVDLVEEFARLYGIDRIPSRVPVVTPARGLSEPRRSLARIRCAAISAGLAETVHMSFVSEISLAALDVSAKEAAALENPLSLAASHLRPTLLPGILSTASLNLRRGAASSVRLFEMGPVFLPGEPVREEQRLAVVVTGPADPPHFSRRDRSTDFYDLKGILETVLGASETLIRSVRCVPARIAGFDPSSSAAVQIADTPIGCLGRISPKSAAHFELPADVFAAEISLSRILAFPPGAAVYRPIPKFPSIRRDLSLIVREVVTASAVQEAVAQAKIPNLTACDVFDVYRGKGLAGGTYALGLTFVFQSPDRTLSDEEVNAARDSILSVLGSRLGAELRAGLPS